VIGLQSSFRGIGLEKKSFQQWLSGLAGLSAQQLSLLKTRLDSHLSRQEVPQALNEECVEKCPHCASKQLNKFGWKAGLQRYRCKACRATFNRLTGSPLARLRKKPQWTGVLRV
jgi:transposase-like protein